MASVLEVRGLSKKYPKKDVLAADGVSFSVDEGEIFALIGPNGAGKTTTIRMISSPPAETLAWRGTALLRNPTR